MFVLRARVPYVVVVQVLSLCTYLRARDLHACTAFHVTAAVATAAAAAAASTGGLTSFSRSAAILNW